MTRPVFGQPYREPASVSTAGPIITRCKEPAVTFAIHERPSLSLPTALGVIEQTDGAPCYRCLALTASGCHFLRDR